MRTTNSRKPAKQNNKNKINEGQEGGTKDTTNGQQPHEQPGLKYIYIYIYIYISKEINIKIKHNGNTIRKKKKKTKTKQ